MTESVVAPTQSHVFIISNFLTEAEADTIYNEVLHQEDYIMSLGPHRYGGVEGDKLTGRFSYYNALDFKVVGDILKPKFVSLFGKGRWFQSWFNTFREGDCIKPHRHNDPSNPEPDRPKSFQCCNLFLGGDEAEGTMYAGTEFPNTKGGLLVFRDDIVHWTEPYKGKDVRISMACDIHMTRQNHNMRKLN